MAKTPKLLKVPFFVIAYNSKTLFSVDDEDGISTLPVFTQAEAAEKYRQFFAKQFKLKLQVYVVDKIEKGLNLIECASLACKALQRVIINPSVKKTKEATKDCEIQTIIAFLLDQYRSQKGHNRQNPHKK